MTDLTLSNCSLSGEDLASLATFLQGNTTLCSLDLSRNNIESVDTVKAIAKAVNAKGSSIVHVNLSFCALSGGDKGALDKLLASVKKCESLEIGHKSMDSEVSLPPPLPCFHRRNHLITVLLSSTLHKGRRFDCQVRWQEECFDLLFPRRRQIGEGQQEDS